MSQSNSDRAAWVRKTVDEHEDRLLRYAGRLLHNHDTARDVVQETFLKLCQQTPAKLDGKLTPWLYTVTRNRCVDLLRKDRHMSPLIQAQPAAPPGSTGDSQTPLDSVLQDESASLALQAIDSLPQNQQEVVRLKFEQSLSYKQIAQVTGLSTTNVGFLLHTALKTLRKIMTATTPNNITPHNTTPHTSASSTPENSGVSGIANERRLAQ